MALFSIDGNKFYFEHQKELLDEVCKSKSDRILDVCCNFLAPILHEQVHQAIICHIGKEAAARQNCINKIEYCKNVPI
jgi:hypothetical protein